MLYHNLVLLLLCLHRPQHTPGNRRRYWQGAFVLKPLVLAISHEKAKRKYRQKPAQRMVHDQEKQGHSEQQPTISHTQWKDRVKDRAGKTKRRMLEPTTRRQAWLPLRPNSAIIRRVPNNTSLFHITVRPFQHRRECVFFFFFNLRVMYDTNGLTLLHVLSSGCLQIWQGYRQI